MYLGSDALALAPFTDEITYLEDGDWAVLTRDGAEIRDVGGAPGRRASASASRPRPSWSTRATTATSWRRRSTSSPRWSAARSPITSTSPTGRVALPEALPFDFAGPVAALDHRLRHRLSMPASSPSTGSSSWRGCPVEIDVASEFRYREPPLEPGRAGARHLAIGRDRRHAGLAALRQGAGPAHRWRSSTCRPRPSRARATVVVPTLAGPEIGVASTKAFTCQLTVLLCLAIAAGRARGHARREARARARRRADRRCPA